MAYNKGILQKEIEDKIIDLVAFGSDNRLIIFKPENSIVADFTVKKRSDYVSLSEAEKMSASRRIKKIIGISPKAKKTREIFLKIINADFSFENKIFSKEVSQNELDFGQDSFIVFAYFDEADQQIFKNICLIPSLIFKDIAEISESETKNKIFKLESFLDENKNDKFSKFLVNKNKFADALLDIIDSKSMPGSKGAVFNLAKNFNEKEIKEFIAEARLNTYARGAKPADNPRLSGSLQLEFKKAKYFYRDIYFAGKNNFIGQEVVYKDSNPVWAMNYFGNSFEKQIDKKATDFLKESLLQLADKCRFGQMCQFEKDEFLYKDAGEGLLEKFFGKEEIFLKDKSIYKLVYQGGAIYKD